MCNDLVDALRGKWGRQRDISRRAGVDKSIISRAANKRSGLSVEAAEQLGEVLGTDPVALFINSNVAAKAAQVDAGEVGPGDALASLSRVASKVDEMHRSGKLTASPDLTEAVELLSAAIRELSGETEATVQKYAGRFDPEDYENFDKGRDGFGNRIAPLNQTVEDLEADDQNYNDWDEDYDNFDEGRPSLACALIDQ